MTGPELALVGITLVLAFGVGFGAGGIYAWFKFMRIMYEK